MVRVKQFTSLSLGKHVTKADQRGFFFLVLRLYLIIWSAFEGRKSLFSLVTYAAVKGDIRRLPQINSIHTMHKTMCFIFPSNKTDFSVLLMSSHCLFELASFQLIFRSETKCLMLPRPNLNYRTWRNVTFPYAHNSKQPLIWDMKGLTYFCCFHIVSRAIGTIQK